MSQKYTPHDLQRLSKAALIALLHRQPEVPWPTRVCTYKEPHQLSVKHIKKALTGPYGFYKAEISGTNNHGDDQEQPNHLTASIGAVSISDNETALQNSSVMEESQDVILKSVGEPETSEEARLTTVSPVYEFVGEETEANDASAFNPPPTHDPASPPPPSIHSPGPALAPLLLSPDDIENHDIGLMTAFVERNPSLRDQLQLLRSHRHKKQKDSILVIDYEVACTTSENFLHKCDWANESGRIPAKTVYKFLGVSASWVSLAKSVTTRLKAIGPNGENPDPEVTMRLHSTDIVKKGDDLLTFLKFRMAQRENSEV